MLCENGWNEGEKMMIRGYKKNLVVIKNIGSDYIDEAYFILKNDLPEGAAGGDIVKEANRIVSEYQTGKKRKRLPFSLTSFLLGAIAASVICLIVFKLVQLSI